MYKFEEIIEAYNKQCLFTSEDFNKIIDKINSVGCTSFLFTADELKQIIERKNNEI